MITLLLHLLRLLPFVCGGHRQLALENLALHQQLAVYTRTATRPKLRRTDRLFWVVLARVWAGWRQPLLIVTPATVLRWQRRRFCEHWTTLSSRPQVGRPPVNAEIAALVRRMAATNPLWGAPRIHGELMKLGVKVAERTVSRLLPKRRTPSSQGWRTFLANHVRDLVSIDFFTVPTAGLRVLFILVVLAHDTITGHALTSRSRRMHRMGGQSSGRRWARSCRFLKSAVYIIATSAGQHNPASTGPRPAINVLPRLPFVVSAVIRPARTITSFCAGPDRRTMPTALR
jgi:hypothetical protein